MLRRFCLVAAVAVGVAAPVSASEVTPQEEQRLMVVGTAIKFACQYHRGDISEAESYRAINDYVRENNAQDAAAWLQTDEGLRASLLVRRYTNMKTCKFDEEAAALDNAGEELEPLLRD